MADCESIPTRLSLRLDRQLSADENAQLDADLQRCPDHIALAQTLTHIDLLFRSAPHLAPPRDLTRVVLARIEQRRDQRILGLTFLLGSLLSLGPTLLLGLALLLGLGVIAQPSLIQSAVRVIIAFVNQLLAVSLTVGIVQETLGPWLFPGLAAAFGLLLLSITTFLARRVAPIPHSLHM